MISATIQHALRALGQLSLLNDEEFLLGRDLAALADVPASYLSKILRTLGKAGLVEATRGLNGGYRLARPAHEITLRQVVAALEPDTLEAVCFLHGKRPCTKQDACPIHEQYLTVREEFDRFLATSTLADVAPGVAPP
jgi:Rrf2 family protein